ncbi:MAG: IclR family transcriptional regulator [Cupriavidus necator]
MIGKDGVQAEPRDGAQSVRRALAVLRLVATGQERGVRLTDIAAMSGLSRPTVHRLLKMLIAETAVEQDPSTRRYRIGTEITLLGLARAGRFAVRGIAEPYLRELAAEVGDTVFLSVRHGADSVCIGRYLGSHPIQVLSIDVGVRRPLGASVSGIVLLAGLDQADVQEITAANQPRLTLQGLDAQGLLREVQRARKLNYAYAAHGVMPGTRAVAVPVRDEQNQVVAAVSIAALADRLDRKRLTWVVERMQHHATTIHQRYSDIAKARPKA